MGSDKWVALIERQASHRQPSNSLPNYILSILVAPVSMGINEVTFLYRATVHLNPGFSIVKEITFNISISSKCT